jgi:hypothetical protein
MRKEFMVIAAIIAVALAGYLTWQSARNDAPVVQTSTPTAPARQADAAQNTPAAATPTTSATPAPATPPAQPSQPAQQ